MHSTLDTIAQQLGAVGAQGGLQAVKNLMFSAVDITNLIFFQRINAFLNDEIKEFGVGLLENTMTWVLFVGTLLATIWVMIQGFRIITGQSRDSMMALVVNALKVSLIVGIASGWGLGGGETLFDWMGDGLQKNINKIVTGRDGDVYENIDRSLGYMQLAFTSIDTLQDANNPLVDDAKSRAMWFTGIGTGGPAITAGVMLLLNKIAMALFTGLGPIFILCLLFEQTKSLFSKWLFYGIGAMFSLAVLSVMVSIALDIVTAVAASFWVASFIGASNEGVNSRAMQQGGLGLILTMLIISAPPIAANFFQGTMGQFYASSWFGGGTGSQPGARVGESGYRGDTGGGTTPAERTAGRESGYVNQAPPLPTSARASTGPSPDAIRAESAIGNAGYGSAAPAALAVQGAAPKAEATSNAAALSSSTSSQAQLAANNDVVRNTSPLGNANTPAQPLPPSSSKAPNDSKPS